VSLIYILLAILAFGFLIAIHELGHFVAAKLCNVQVNEFSIGMGPAIFKKKFGETQYSLRLLPLGGFCAMEGEEEESDNERALYVKPAWQRLIIFAAGSFMNFIAGFLIILIIYLPAQGFISNTIADFLDGYEIQENGLRQGDEIISINGHRVLINSDISLLLSRNNDNKHDFVVLRNGEKVIIEDMLLERKEYTVDGQKSMLYGFVFKAEEATFGLKLKNTFNNSIDFVRLVWFSLVDLFTGKASVNDLSGPIGITQVISETAKVSLQNAFYLIAFIAINLSAMNMLPIPALDGSKIVSTIIEVIIGRPINKKVEGTISMICFLLLIGLMIYVGYNDIVRLLS